MAHNCNLPQNSINVCFLIIFFPVQVSWMFKINVLLQPNNTLKHEIQIHNLQNKQKMLGSQYNFPEVMQSYRKKW